LLCKSRKRIATAAARRRALRTCRYFLKKPMTISRITARGRALMDCVVHRTKLMPAP